MKPWGFAIPGLAMNADELPNIPGLVRLQQPGFAGIADFDTQYTIEDLAAYHLKTIQEQMSDDVVIIGMSMGGMIASVLASKFRDQLPKKTKFRFIVTTANPPELSCITKAMMADWYQAKQGDIPSFAKILVPFFGRGFREANPELAENYFRYRATGLSTQSSKSFVKQLTSVVGFNGTSYFGGLTPSEVEFIHGEADEIMSLPHHELLRKIQPEAVHHVISGLGHMVNIEAPHLFEREWGRNA